LKGLVIIFGKVNHQIKAGLSQLSHIVSCCSIRGAPLTLSVGYQVDIWGSQCLLLQFPQTPPVKSEIKHTFHIFQNGGNSELVFEIISRYLVQDGGSGGLVYWTVLRKFAWSLQHLTSDGTSSGKNFWILLTEWIFVILFWEGELHISILLRWAMSQWVQRDDFKDYYFKSVEAICHMSFLERVNCLFAKVFLYAEM